MIDQREDDALDRALDAALAKYTAVEPRPGLEERILANLRAQQSSPAPSRWQWVAVGVAAMLVLVLALSVGSKHRPQHMVRTPNNVVKEGRETQALGHTNKQQPALEWPVSVHTAVKSRPRNRTATAISAPRLAHFPSPLPLSEQERILAGYVAKYPEHAALIAVARTEELRRNEEEMAQAIRGNENSQERNQ